MFWGFHEGLDMAVRNSLPAWFDHVEKIVFLVIK